METTQIYDILLNLLNSNNETLLSSLGVTDITTGQSALRILDAGQVRDLYETCRPTPKPRRNKNADLLRQVWTIREARSIRNAVREKLQRTPSAKAIHDLGDATFFEDGAQMVLSHYQSRFDFTRNWKNGCHRGTYLPDDYNKFFHNAKSKYNAKAKDNVITLIKYYNNMKMLGIGSRDLGGRQMIKIYWNESPGFITTEDLGIYRLLDYIYDTDKNGNNGNLFLKKNLRISFVDERN